MARIELNHFYNDGFGWICKRCEQQLKAREKDSPPQSRLLREGETESREPQFSNLALAKWADAAQKILICPRCEITEPAGNF
ncbi:MAG: hypothetical protein ACR2GD_11590 [Pyrinomonadaceae bacterium]